MALTPLSVRKFKLVFITWWLVWAGLQALIVYWLGFTLREAFIDSLVSNLLLAAACVVVSNTLKYYLPQKERYWYILVLSLGLSGVWLLLCKWLLPYLAGNAEAYISFIQRSHPIRFGVGFLLIACMAMISVLWYTFEEQKENEKRKAEADKLAKEAELFKLRQQLQPHFLFNSLNSISALTGSQPEQARKMIQQLSDFLRGTLKKEEQQWISLLEELQHLALYLAIEKVRFGHRLETVIESDVTTQQMKLPNMLLQPVVENAIKFGLYDTLDAITIKITATIQQQQLVLTVQNPFDPETSQPKQGTGFGLSSVQRRLQLLFGRNDLMTVHVHGNLYTISLTIPQLA